MNPIIIYITVFLGLVLLGLILLWCEERKQDQQGRARMALLAVSEPRKSIDEVV